MNLYSVRIMIILKELELVCTVYNKLIMFGV